MRASHTTAFTKDRGLGPVRHGTHSAKAVRGIDDLLGASQLGADQGGENFLERGFVLEVSSSYRIQGVRDDGLIGRLC